MFLANRVARAVYFSGLFTVIRPYTVQFSELVLVLMMDHVYDSLCINSAGNDRCCFEQIVARMPRSLA